MEPVETFKESLKAHRQSIIQLLRTETPVAAAQVLQKNGWSRKWACAAVEFVEVNDNPGNLRDGAIVNQRIRDHFATHLAIGGGLFSVGLIVTLATLLFALEFGGYVFIAYGAVISGASIWLRAHRKIKEFPDRPIPQYQPPRDKKAHNPTGY